MVNSAAGDVTIPLCSQAVHDGYPWRKVGPDGVMYVSWHPQIDRSGCRFDHEHGSDPDLFVPGYQPLFGYTAAKHGMAEGNAGFKNYAFEDAGNRWLITHHFGTANAMAAACARFHTVDVAVARNGVILANIHLMGDFGPARDNQTQAYLTPAACPNQGPQAAGSSGVRQIPVMDHGNIGYEPWRMDNRPLLFGFSSQGLTFNTPTAQTACDTLDCTANIARTDGGGPARGAWRFLTNNNSGVHIWATATYSGTFYTDPMGMASRAANAPDAVQQYIAPGTDVTFTTRADCWPYNAGGYWYDCSSGPHEEMVFKFNPLITGAN